MRGNSSWASEVFLPLKNLHRTATDWFAKELLTPILFLTDIDECSPSSGIAHGCQMKCNNLPGGYSCSCYNGYYITSNGRECSGNKINQITTKFCKYLIPERGY
jgi:hypothetical protein